MGSLGGEGEVESEVNVYVKLEKKELNRIHWRYSRMVCRGRIPGRWVRRLASQVGWPCSSTISGTAALRRPSPICIAA